MTNYNKQGFTLLELIIVIVIIGILATLGYTQYGNTVEKMRTAEALANVSMMRKLAHNYYFANKTFLTIANADLGVGASADQLPSSCDTKHFFRYGFDWASDTNVHVWGYRCTVSGKTPNWPNSSYAVYIDVVPATGDSGILCWAPDDSCGKLGITH